MSERFTFYVIALMLALIGLFFFRVIQPFVLPLLLSAVLAVVFRPLHLWVSQRFVGRRRVAAGITTIAILITILLPLMGALGMAGYQLVKFSRYVVTFIDSPQDSQLADNLNDLNHSPFIKRIQKTFREFDPELRKQIEEGFGEATKRLIQPVYLGTIGVVGGLVNFLIGFVVMALALYYFLADGDKLIEEVQRLSPLDQAEELVLFNQFERVCRGVIIGSIAAGLAQSVLAGIGFAIAGVSNIWLLMVVTLFFSFIPFLGAGSVCFVVTLGLVFNEHYGAAIFLGIYSLIVVTTVDNLVKAHVIGGSSQLNPLVVLISVIGALQLIGLWGIFVGPMVAAFFYAFLKMLHERLAASARKETDNDLKKIVGVP